MDSWVGLGWTSFHLVLHGLLAFVTDYHWGGWHCRKAFHGPRIYIPKLGVRDSDLVYEGSIWNRLNNHQFARGLLHPIWHESKFLLFVYDLRYETPSNSGPVTYRTPPVHI